MQLAMSFRGKWIDQRSPDGVVRTVGTKRCSRCQATKPFTEYRKRSDRRDGHQAYCRQCANRKAKCYVPGRTAEPIECKGANGCGDMPWRRPPDGCKRCKRPYAPEDMRTVRHHVLTNSAGNWESVMPDTSLTPADLWPSGKRKRAPVATP